MTTQPQHILDTLSEAARLSPGEAIDRLTVFHRDSSPAVALFAALAHKDR